MRDARPTFVRDRDPNTAKLGLESDPDKVRNHIRHGYINGVDPGLRDKFYEILDDAKAKGEPMERIKYIRGKLSEIDRDPKQIHLAKYLKAEMMHIMNTFNVRPNEYKIDEAKLT